MVEIEVTYTPALIGVGPDVGDDVDASCEAFEMQVHRELTAQWPDVDVSVTRLEGPLADLGVVTHGVVDWPGVLTLRSAAWSVIWDLIGPYGAYRRPVRGGIWKVPATASVALRDRGPDAFDLLIEEVYGDMIIEVDEDEVRAVMRSGFGVAL